MWDSGFINKFNKTGKNIIIIGETPIYIFSTMHRQEKKNKVKKSWAQTPCTFYLTPVSVMFRSASVFHILHDYTHFCGPEESRLVPNWFMGFSLFLVSNQRLTRKKRDKEVFNKRLSTRSHPGTHSTVLKKKNSEKFPLINSMSTATSAAPTESARFIGAASPLNSA